MARGFFIGGGDTGKPSYRQPPRTNGRHNGGNPPGCMTFLGFVLLLAVGVAVLLAYVNLSG